MKKCYFCGMPTEYLCTCGEPICDDCRAEEENEAYLEVEDMRESIHSVGDHVYITFKAGAGR